MKAGQALAARIVAALALVTTALFFLLPFSSLHLNFDRLFTASVGKAVADSAPSELRDCLHALTELPLASYTGTTEAFGGTPTTEGVGVPSACNGGAPTPGHSLSGNEIEALRISSRSLGKIGLALIGVALLVGLLPLPGRGAIAAGASVTAFAVLLANQLTLGPTVADKAGQSLARLNLAAGGAELRNFIDVRFSDSLYTVLALLVVATVLQLAGAIPRRHHRQVAAPSTGAPDPSAPATAAPPDLAVAYTAAGYPRPAQPGFTRDVDGDGLGGLLEEPSAQSKSPWEVQPHQPRDDDPAVFPEIANTPTAPPQPGYEPSGGGLQPGGPLQPSDLEEPLPPEAASPPVPPEQARPPVP